MIEAPALVHRNTAKAPISSVVTNFRVGWACNSTSRMAPLPRSGLGQVPGGDVATQQAALAQVEATLPPLQKQLAQQRNLLATLIGRMPSDAPAERFDLASLTLPQNLPVSLPSKLVEQRPDVRAAEANLHSAGAQVGVAVANQLPQISLNLSIGSPALEPYQLFGPGLVASQVGGGFLAPLLDGGALQARKRAAVAAFEQADAQYRSTVLTAFRNVADTLRALEYDALTLKARSEAERAAAVSLKSRAGASSWATSAISPC